MYQLDLCPEDPADLQDLEFLGRAFVVHTEQGWSAWIPFRPGFVVGLYYTATDWVEAIEAVEEFNEQLTEQKGSK